MKIPRAPSAVQITADELEAAHRPIASLLRKSEKAKQKLAPGTWQHAMLRNNIRALRLASVLLDKESHPKRRFAENALLEARRVIAALIQKTEKTRARFPRGTSQHTLQKNRLQALRVAEALIKVALDQYGARQKKSPGRRGHRTSQRRRAS